MEKHYFDEVPTKENNAAPSPASSTIIRIRIRIPLSPDVDLYSKSGIRITDPDPGGKKMKKKMYFLVDFCFVFSQTNFSWIPICKVSGSTLDPDLMTLWICIRIRIELNCWFRINIEVNPDPQP
jgi:hypothetical protein